jgi:hypothetical protein
MKGVDRSDSVGCPLVPFHVQGDALADVLGRADTVDASLGLAEAAVAAFDGVAGGRQQPVIQEGQGLFQVGREQFVQRAADPLEAADAPPEAAQLGQSGLGAAPPVEQAVNFIHDLAERSQVRQAASDPLERSLFDRRQMMLNEQVAIIEQVGHSLLDSLGLVGLGPVGLGGTASRKGRLFGLEFLADLGHRVQHGPDDFFEDVELADLMASPGEHLLDHLGIKRRAVRRDAQDLQTSGVHVGLELAEELPNVLLGRVVFQHPVSQPLERAVVHDVQHAERPVVDLVGRQVAAERGQGPVQVFTVDAPFAFFPPPPRPSSGSWRRAQRPGGLARDANWPPDRAGRLRSPAAPPAAGRGGCTGTWAGPDRPCRR